ncbi:MAG: PD40 domain-containing protein, partial [Acidobacteria bacterium]|nr:PD40 domain-containing protein [Acidobacteriota bacterium]
MSVLRRCKVLLLAVFVMVSLASAQETPPSIVADGIPAVPSDLRQRMNQYLNMRSASFADWHPTDRAMLISTRFGDTNQLHLVSAPGGYRRQLTFYPDRVTGGSFSPRKGGDLLIFGMDTGGSEFYQLYRFDLTDGSIRMITDGKSRNVSLLFSHSGKLAAYTSTRRNQRDFDVYLLDPENPASEKRAIDVQGVWAPLDWSPDDGRLVLIEYISVNESYLHLFDLASGREELLTPKGLEKVFYDGTVWAKDSKGLYLISDRGSEFRRLFYYDLAAKTFTSLSEHIPWDVEDLDISPDGRVLAFTANEDGISKLHLLDTSTRRELPSPELPPGQVFNLKFHRARNDLALNINSAKSPSDVYSYNLESG